MEEKKPFLEQGQRIKTMIDNRGLTQAETARRAFISQTCLSRYISGVRVPDAITLSFLASALECSLDYLMCKTDVIQTATESFDISISLKLGNCQRQININ